MKLTEGYVILKDVRFHAFHGVMPQETKVGADFIVNLRIGYPLEQAMESDEVGDTLNYAEVYDLVKQEMKQPSKLLENVAGRIVQTISKHFPSLTIFPPSISVLITRGYFIEFLYVSATLK